MFFLGLILPAIAVSIAAWFLVRPLLSLLQINNIELGTYPCNEVQLTKLAVERNQEDEATTLLELGFTALGANWFQVGDLGNKRRDHSLIFSHSEFPVFACLCVNRDNQKFLKLITNDKNGRIISTSSCDHSLDLKDEFCRCQVVSASFAEEIFEYHVRVLHEWESDGFKPLSARTIEQFETLVEDEYRLPACQKVVRSAFLESGFCSLILTVALPVLIAAGISLVFCKLFQMDWSWLLALQIASIVSLANSVFWYVKVYQGAPNPQDNSMIGYLSAPDRFAPVAIKVNSDGADATIETPFRNTKPFVGLSIIYSMFSVLFLSIPVAIASKIIITILANPQLFNGILAVIGVSVVLIGNLVLIGFALPIASLAFRSLIGKSRQELSIGDGYIHTKERTIIRHYHRSIEISRINKIVIENLEGVEWLTRWLNGVSLPEFGLVELHLTNQTKQTIMEAYPIEYLASLAPTLADLAGLDSNQVSMSKSISGIHSTSNELDQLSKRKQAVSY